MIAKKRKLIGEAMIAEAMKRKLIGVGEEEED
jgi:hypothetical protein